MVGYRSGRGVTSFNGEPVKEKTKKYLHLLCVLYPMRLLNVSESFPLVVTVLSSILRRK